MLYYLTEPRHNSLRPSPASEVEEVSIPSSYSEKEMNYKGNTSDCVTNMEKFTSVYSRVEDKECPAINLRKDSPYKNILTQLKKSDQKKDFKITTKDSEKDTSEKCFHQGVNDSNLYPEKSMVDVISSPGFESPLSLTQIESQKSSPVEIVLNTSLTFKDIDVSTSADLNFNIPEDFDYGSNLQRRTAILKKCTENPRILDFKDYRNLNHLNQVQAVSFIALGAGAFIPIWASRTKRRFRSRNSKIWAGLITAQLMCIGVHIFYSNKSRKFLNSLDKKYFANETLKQISHS